ncbi:MAG: hypothetical protein ABI113_11750, partial [Mucilaginibacter sp.]
MFNRTLLTLLLTVLVCKIANAQAYDVQALDGPAQKIRLKDNEKSTLIISCLQDTIYVHNLNNIEEATLLNHNFLKVVYITRSGVGMHLQHSVILCINKKKLIEALHFESLFHEEFMDFSEDADTTGKVAVNS